MEVNSESMMTPQDNSAESVADSVWKYINNPIIAIFSDLQNPATEQMLCSLLESLLKRSSTLITVLVPPFSNNAADETLQQLAVQYAAFTTWLFGTMFYLVCKPSSNVVLSNSIEVQACMLRILSTHHMTMFQTISSEYLNILDEIFEFHTNSTETEEMTLSKFHTEKDIIQNLDLTPFPAKIKLTNVPLVQTSLLKIIMKTGVLVWDQEKLLNKTITIIVKSPPDLKIEALHLCTEIIKNGIVHEKEFTAIIMYSLEIVKSLPTWINSNLLPINSLYQFAEILTHLIQLSPVSLSVTELCFQVIDFTASECFTHADARAETIEKLMEATCYKIKQYLSVEPSTVSEIGKFLSYFTRWPAIIDIFMQFIFIDIRRVVVPNEVILATEISKPWALLRKELINFMEAGKFTEVLHIVKASALLQSWLEKEEIQIKLYENDLNCILKILMQNLNSDARQDGEIVFEILIHLMAHKESNKVLLQSILALPFTQDFKGSMDISQKMVEKAKSLNVKTMSKCLETLCAHGNGRERLKLLRVCILNGEAEIAVAAVSNSVLLLNDANIQLEDVCQYVLNTALSSTKVEIHEALANVLSPMVCVSSRKGRIISESLNDRKWTIYCECCTKNTQENTESSVHFLPRDHDHIFNAYFKLLSSTNVSIRLHMSKSILSLSNHIKSFNSNEVTKEWLSYIHDDNVEIRSNIASVIGRLLSNKISTLESECLPDTVPDDLDEYVDLVIDVIANTLMTALNNSNHSLHDTLLDTAKNFVCVPLHITEGRILNVFLITILHLNSSLAAVASATMAYQDVASFLNVSTKALYIRYRKSFLKLIMERAVSNYIDFSYNMATTVHRIAKCIGYEGSRQLLRKDGHYAICFLIVLVVENPKANVLLNDIAELISMDKEQMLQEYFPYICSYAFLETPLRIATGCLKLVSRITKMSLAVLTKQSFMGIFEELMLNFHESPEKIVNFLEIISEFDSNQKGNFGTQEEVAAYLNLRLHGILVNFDIKLGPKSDEYTQQSALASLAALIRYMGAAYLTPLRYKILATLRTSLGFKRPGFPTLVCKAWDAFIHNIAIEDLGTLFPTICVSLIPLQKIFPEKVNSMLEFLIVENSGEHSSHISELFFIDDMDVPTHISNIVKARILQARPEGFNANLMLWLKRITHETDEVRIRALKHLQTFLEKHRSELNRMILSETDVHPLIVELLDTLLIGCQDKDESIRLCYGECLGELGAIEPSLLPRRIISREDSKFISDINEKFACALLLEHVRAFQMQKNSQSMDCFSLAIQEILKAYDISPQGQNSELWNNLPSTMQQIIIPFLTSHYKIATVSDDDEFPHPIYDSEADSSVESWAYNWLCSMSSAVRDTTLNKVLQACKLAFKRDIKTLIFCLPYIVSYIIANNREEEHVKLREEMLAVIKREKPVLDPELLRHQPLQYGQSVKADDERISEETRRTRYSRVVFCILDHLQRWLRERRLFQDSRYEAIKRFCDRLDSLVVTKGCYQSQEYHRALMYLEQHMASTNKGLSELTEGGLLAKIYAQLDEPDGVSGILATQDQFPTLQQLVVAHEVNGQLQDAATCYERLVQNKNLEHTYLQGMIQCYLGLDQPFTAKHITEGLLSSRPELEPLITERELFWRLAHFSRFEETSQKNIKHVLLDDLIKGTKPDLLSLKKNLVQLLEDASRPGVYQQSYSHIMKLHILNEFDKAVSMMLNNAESLPTILEEWEERGQLLRASRGVEFVLSMRRATLDLAVQLEQKTHNTENSMLKQEIGKIWLKSAKIARKAGFHQQAYMHILSASDSCPPQPLYIEQAQLYWQKGCQEDAFTTLKRCFSNCFQPAQYYKQLSSGDCNEERKQCAKAKLLFAKYNDETLNVDTDGSILNYKEAIEVWRGWEKSWLACAEYYNTIVERMSEEDKDRNRRDLQIHMLNFYGKSLQYGCKYIHHSMPKMLTVWLDVASRATLASDPPDVIELRQDRLTKMTQIMEVYHHRLPTFMWLTAFSQLVSRICHPSPQVQSTLCTILVKLISTYPQHCLWMMASVFNSSYPARQKRCQEILNHAQLKTSSMSKLIKDFHRLWERLIELSNKPVSDGTLNTTVNVLSKNLPRLLASKDFSAIMIPTTKFRQLHLPSKNASMKNHNPFLLRWVHITKIEENVMIMPSLQRPRRITLRGSDGKQYLFMCKPKDDLRKDFRLMEFNDIVNKYLQNDPESRQRRLYIRTYSVVPLNEECGLIEWVPNLVGFRPTIMNLYKEKGIALTNRELKTYICTLKDPLEKKRQIFLQKLLPRHPPVFGDWFRIMFPDPYGWYEARTAYTRTTAVMSMVGYILGLGDRHGENILFDSKCGDCVHVDFNCLFNRGELFDWPERVPFRLTHNMVDAMGPLKIEGPFRRACQVTMRVLRQESSTLMSVLTPFVYDPLVSWNRNQPGEAAEKTNEKAVEHIKNIEQRLKGLVRYPGRKAENIALHLSVEGQTNHLILEATNTDNLCQMYFGWGAYL
ncbi:serine/threonine-protein kinase ATR [Linepithema humile]|uniref:serine/threonine-protein kinase ATR n=1 Tax=Linepithema humile TaxID=83485 RepID=UPI0006237A0A|nr:PREDICTED: serine/threonine-protein kinase ATR [Linepithema humile]XP_012230548.1 PREDICTED: serine/threonine-protein kinase ATR [Linepithema humile]XP_012230549.1 PREDICTED: serine/threonine-protein kinase ATR [Linepithema humile]